MAVRLRHSDRRLLLLVGLAAVIGAAAGGAAYLLVRTISFITNAALFGKLAWGEIPPLSDLDPSPRLPIAAAAGALVVAAVAMVAPMIRGHLDHQLGLVADPPLAVAGSSTACEGPGTASRRGHPDFGALLQAAPGEA